MENLSYVTRPLAGPPSPSFLYETFPPLPARSSYLRVPSKYFHLAPSVAIRQNTKALSSA